MRKRFVYFSLSLGVALAALLTQFSPPRAVAQRPVRDDATAECRACDAGCTVAFDACTAERGTRGPGFASCMREFQDCRQTCNGRGGPCHPQAEPADETPAPTPTPTPTPD